MINTEYCYLPYLRNHELGGSASPGLTATGCINEKKANVDPL